MAIRQKPNGKFQVDVTVKGQDRFVQTVATEQEAIALEKEKFEQLKFGASSSPAPKGMWTLGEAFRKTCSIIWEGQKAETSSIASAKQAIKFFGDHRPLDTIDTDSVDEYISHLKGQGKADSTINRKLAALSKMMTVAVQRGHLKAKPYMPRKKEAQGRIRWITSEEEAKMLQLIKQWGQDNFHDVVVCLIDTGLRVGELRGLSSRDVDFTTNLITVWDTKNGDSRSVPMTKRVVSIMARRNGEFNFTKNWIRTPWDRLKGVMGLDKDTQFVPHCLRHTCASRLVQRGVNLKVIQTWMGHKSIQITLRYAHLAPSNLMDAVKVLEAPQLTLLKKAQ